MTITKEKLNQAKEYVEKVSAIMSTDPDIIKMVKDIEGGIKTTKDNYGRYMGFLSNFTSQSKLMVIGVAKGMKLAGGNVNGIDWAVKLLVGDYND